MNPPDTAPRDMTVFLGNFGYPWLLMTAWNGADEKWVTATLQLGLVDGEYNDSYFENEREHPDELRGWLPIPTNS